MTSAVRPTQPAPAPHDGSWWDRHRDFVLYPVVLVVVVALGLVWNGALSLVLTPVWMLLGIWVIPSAIGRLVRSRR